MALLRRGDLSVTEVCVAAGCSLLGTFSTRFSELVGMLPSTYRRQSAGATAGLPPCLAKQVTRPIRNREAPRADLHFSMTVMDVTIHASFLPHDDPEASVAFFRDALGFEVRSDVGSGTMRWITVGPPAQPSTSILLAPPATDPGITDDERRTIAEMMAKGTYGWILLATDDLDGTFAANTGQRRRGHPGADRAALRGPRLRVPRSGGQRDPHQRGALSELPAVR